MRPDDVNYHNANSLRERLYKSENINKTHKRFKKDDIVRITKDKGNFAKGYLPNFTDELFRISRVNNTSPPSYRIIDLEGEEIKGIFYNQELVKTTQQTSHRAEVLNSRTRNGIKEHLVRWVGHSDKHNSWVKDSDLVKNG